MRDGDKEKPGLGPAPSETAGQAPGDLFSHFVRRTDNDFHGVEDKSLIGEDIGFDDEDEDEKDLDEIDRPA